MKRILVLLIAAAALLLPAASFAADGTAVYKGYPEEFAFVPGSAYSTSDLFSQLKDVLPGDTISQTIRVDNGKNCVARLYLKADPVDQAQKDFLDRLRLRVVSGNTLIFDAPAGEQDGLSSYRLLGAFGNGGGVTLTLTLTVPSDLGNNYAGKAGGIQWTFLAQEIRPGVDPRTGEDDTDMILKLSASVLIVAIAAVGVLLFRRRGIEYRN